jgi:hypothetical protein
MEFIYSENAVENKVIRCRCRLEGGEDDTLIIETLRTFAEDLL